MAARYQIRGTALADDLDLIRGAAALAVFFGHVRGLFFIDYKAVDSNPFQKALYFFTGFGHEAVVLFFVLSGFLIAGSVVRAVEERKWSWRSYVLSLGSRLYVVLIPALLLGALWDVTGLSLPSTTTANHHGAADSPHFAMGDIGENLTPKIFAGNLLFLRSIYVPTFGSKGPLWSLANEFWYYAIFPLLYLAAAGSAPLWRRGANAAAAALLLWFIGPSIASYFLIWLMGAALCARRPASPVRRSPAAISAAIVSFLLFCVALTLARTLFWSKLFAAPAGFSDFVLGAAFTLFLYTLIPLRPNSREGLYRRSALLFSNMSYTLYATFPLLWLIRSHVISDARWQPDALHLALAAMLSLAVFAYSLALSRLTEARTGRVRAWLDSLFGGGAKQEQLAPTRG